MFLVVTDTELSRWETFDKATTEASKVYWQMPISHRSKLYIINENRTGLAYSVSQGRWITAKVKPSNERLF